MQMYVRVRDAGGSACRGKSPQDADTGVFRTRAAPCVSHSLSPPQEFRLRAEVVGPITHETVAKRRRRRSRAPIISVGIAGELGSGRRARGWFRHAFDAVEGAHPQDRDVASARASSLRRFPPYGLSQRSDKQAAPGTGKALDARAAGVKIKPAQRLRSVVTPGSPRSAIREARRGGSQVARPQLALSVQHVNRP